MRLRTCLSYFVISALLLLVNGASARAERIEIGNLDNDEVRVLEYNKDQLVQITVHLMSYGDLVENYLVTLRREPENTRIKTLLSDRNGIVRFRGISAGKYRVELSSKRTADGNVSTVRVGDVVLKARAVSASRSAEEEEADEPGE